MGGGDGGGGETIYICQTLFSEKSKNISKGCLLNFFPTILSAKYGKQHQLRCFACFSFCFFFFFFTKIY